MAGAPHAGYHAIMRCLAAVLSSIEFNPAAAGLLPPRPSAADS
jgi:hypothetical protein